MIRVAAVQIDTNTAAYIKPIDYLKEPISFLKGRPGCGISNLDLKEGQVQQILNDFLSNKIVDKYIDYKISKLKIILHYCNKHRVNLVVFPEYSIPAGCLPFLQHFVKDENIHMDIIAGSHAVIRKNEEIYRKIGININMSNDLGKAISPVITSEGKVLHSEKLMGAKGDLSITPGTFKGPFEITVSGKTYLYLNFICIDFIADKNKKIIDAYKDSFERSDFIVVPAYTPRIDYFERLSTNDIWGYNKPVIFVNGSDGGGTKIFCHFDPPHILQDSFGHCTGSYQFPPDEEGIIIVEFDPQMQFSKHPTPINFQNSSTQHAVTPIIYSDTLGKYEYVLESYDNILKNSSADDSLFNIIKLLQKHEKEVRLWGRNSRVLLDKISKLFLFLENSSNEKDIFFHIEALIIDKDKNLLMMDEWRQEKIKEIISFLENLFKQKEKRLSKEDEEKILKIRNYYRDYLIKMGSKDLIKKRDIERIKRENKKIKVLITYTERPSFCYFKDYLKQDYGFNVITPEDNETFHPQSDMFIEQFEDIQKDFTAIIFFLSDTDNYLNILSNLPKKHITKKCILVYDNNVIRYSNISPNSFYHTINLSGFYHGDEEKSFFLNQIAEAIKRLSEQEMNCES